MTKDNNKSETIEAADITLTHTLEQSTPATATRRTPLSVYIIATLSLASIVLLAVAIMQKDRLVNDDNDSKQPDTNQVQPTLSKEQGPFQLQRLAAARHQTQDVLARIIDIKHSLEAKNVTQWAEQSYLHALSKAEQGDLFYRQQLFTQAQQSYGESEAELLEINLRIAPLIKTTLAEGQTALDSGDPGAAETSFKLVLAIEKDNQTAIAGIARAALLPQVLTLMAEADKAMSEGLLEGALVKIAQLLTIDNQHKPAIEAHRKIRQQLQNVRFQRAMNQGFNFLSQANYPAAIVGFEQALAAKPDSTTAARALAQAKNEFNQSRVSNLLETAIEHERAEQWPQAITLYQQILTIDNTVVSAKVGEMRSTTRAKLDSNLAALITRPLRLSSPAVYQQAGKLLADASKLQAGNPQLSGKITQLEGLLIDAATPRAVTLTSDSATVVTVLKIGKLGLFNSRVVELKPGKYVAEGVRSGYRDVRIDFVVDFKQTIANVHIACVEPV